MKKLLFTLFLTGMSVLSFAQLKVNSNGKVNVSTTNTASYSNLFVGPDTIFNPSMTNIGVASSPGMQNSRTNIGVEAVVASNLATNTNRNFGVFGLVRSTTCSNGINHGISGMIDYVNGTGVYGAKSLYTYYYPINIQGKYAGYFYGPVYISENLTVQSINQTSDLRLKENVVPIEETDDNGEQTLQNILSMNVVEYNLKERQQAQADNIESDLPDDIAEIVETDRKDKEALAAQRHYGLIAQELQAIYPNLVNEGQDGYLSINYTELVPILIRSIQVLKEELDIVKGSEARMGISSQTTDVAQNAIPTGNILYQNTPNPFTAQTEIRFSLSEGVQNAYIYIFDMTGKTLKQISVTPEQESVTIQGYELNSGIYLYSLVVNGQEIDTKRMILSK